MMSLCLARAISTSAEAIVHAGGALLLAPVGAILFISLTAVTALSVCRGSVLMSWPRRAFDRISVHSLASVFFVIVRCLSLVMEMCWCSSS